MGTLRDRMMDLVAGIRARAADTEAQRRVAPESIAELSGAGLFRAFVPRSYGGDERSPGEVYEAVVEVARACTSTGWVASLLTAHNFMLALLDRTAQDEIFAAGPDVLLASSVAPMGVATRVDGGYRLTGKWSFASGVDHAKWMMLGSSIKDEPPGPPPPGASTFPGLSSQGRIFFISSADYTIQDDWHVAGLRGTGSKTIAVADAFVPARRVLPLPSIVDGTAPGFALHTSPLYRLPWSPLFNSAFPPVALGTALAMLDGFRSYIGSRVNSFSGKGYRANPGSLMRLAEAATRVDSARALHRRDVAMLDAGAAGTPVPRGASERIIYDAGCVVHACSEAIDRMYRGSGGRSLYESSALQRHVRDINAMTQHMMADLDLYGEAYGKVLVETSDYTFGADEAR
ncbi:MAG TPA: acyl-CoA dehydrogenase family protein [Kofleriaceae bacterium]|jgi:3-hydroxy-9,10-secoandrosta-1,3,5(10)-triene-9,17-dione monooxygenase